MGSATTASWLDLIERSSQTDLLAQRASLKESLNKLLSEKKVLDEQLIRLKLEMSFKETNIAAINRRLEDQEYKADFNKYTDLIITDHAALRYVERVLGIKIEGIKKDIINGFPDKIADNCTSVKTGKTVYRIVKDKQHFVITTIIKKRS